ncbi:hypothetical protein [Peribacillus tepidiphilus]|jgi:hypothetical protein|uniref:hypothetical protein n=1 Tax=Peribacillus tepidiphilus TaxID=2652445 RepID=UPI0035B56048
MNQYQQPYYSNNPYDQFPQYPYSEIMAHQMPKQMLYPHFKNATLTAITPFVNYGLKEGKHTSFKHALEEVAAMSYLLGKGFDPQTAYLTVESWELNEYF